MPKRTILEDPLHIARFWSKVDVRRSTVCWEWRAAKNEHGYGVFRSPFESLTLKAHRVAWALANGTEVRPDTTINHTCDNPGCVNPGHLYAGDQVENIADMHSRRRRRYETKFNETDIREIKQRAETGTTQKSLASEYGCSQAYISMLVSGSRGAAIEKGIAHVR